MMFASLGPKTKFLPPSNVSTGQLARQASASTLTSASFLLVLALSILWTWPPFLPASSSTPLVNSPSLVHPSALPPSASHSLPPSVSRQPSRSSTRSPSCLTLKLACCSSGIVLLGASSAFPLGSPRPPPSPKPRPTSTMRSATASSPCALAPCHQTPGCKPPCPLLLVVLVSATLPDTALPHMPSPSSTPNSFAMLWTPTTSPTTATLSSQPPRMCSPLTVCLRLCRPPSDSNSCPRHWTRPPLNIWPVPLLDGKPSELT